MKRAAEQAARTTARTTEKLAREATFGTGKVAKAAVFCCGRNILSFRNFLIHGPFSESSEANPSYIVTNDLILFLIDS